MGRRDARSGQPLGASDWHAPGPLIVASAALLVVVTVLLGVSLGVVSYLARSRRSHVLSQLLTRAQVAMVLSALATLFGVMLAFAISTDRSDREGPSRKARAMIRLQSAFSGEQSAALAGTERVPAPASRPAAIRGKVIVIDRTTGVVPDYAVYHDLWGPTGGGEVGGGWIESAKSQIEGSQAPRVSVLSLRVPDGTLASTPAEAKTIVLIDWDRDFSNSYDGPSDVKGYRIVCRLSFVDRIGHLYWGNQAAFSGQRPPDRITVDVGTIATSI